MNNILWYNKPAADRENMSDESTWNNALPVGNGRLGAMVFGGIKCEQIQLNEETLWSGYYEDSENPEVIERLPELRKLIFEKRYAEAQLLCEKYLVCKGKGSHSIIEDNGHYGSYQTAGTIFIDRNQPDNIESYKRSLDLYNGIATTEFDGTKRETFSSDKYNVVVTRITGNVDNIAVRYDRADPFANINIKYDGDLITAVGDHHDGKGMNYAVAVKTVRTDSEVIIYAAVATDYIDKNDPLTRCLETVNKAAEADINEMTVEHKAYFNKYMGRVSLNLKGENCDNIPTNERLKNPDKDLISTYFQFGRYLLVSSSKGVLPANLQGIWCKDYLAPWESDYHININIQMNYWPAETTNLSEFADPFFRYIESLSEWGKETAEKTYGCRGWVAHTITNPWGFTALGEHPSWGAFMCAGAWCCRHLWEHYLFTGDKEFIRKYYPVIKSSAEFFMDFLVKDPNTGYMVTCPSNSPENWFFDPETHAEVAMSPGPTMDNSILFDLFSMASEIADILGIDEEFSKQAKEFRDMLPPIRIGKYGQIMEWVYDFDEVEPGHRHMSHLYALHPSDTITESKTPELFKACAKTLERRLASGGGHTGWSRAWIVNFYSRLKNGEKACQNVEALIQKSTQDNMFDSHPPFQIDGNFGGTAGIAEMLLQSHEGFVNILPAIPEKWADGEFRGLVARGGFEVSAVWQNGKVISVEVKSLYGNDLKIFYNGEMHECKTEKGLVYIFA